MCYSIIIQFDNMKASTLVHSKCTNNNLTSLKRI
uniref:Uncharacterized protein n=1 Tax=Rhizophora mucronata TaxID=61149 RepID=A0A2P2NU02_RHIMU